MRTSDTQLDSVWFSRYIVLSFAESGDDDKGGKEESGETEEEEQEEESETDKDDKEGQEDKGNSGLKSALEKERDARKRLEKETKALRKFKEEAESKDKSESEQAREAERKSAEKVAKLGARLRDQAVESTIAKIATKMKFRDVDDAISLVKRGDISVEQDEDEPEEIEVDEKSVEKAVKELATKKPHLLVADGEEQRSGGKFGGGNKGKGTDEEALARKYPALRRPRT